MKRKVVVLGGGIAGLLVARDLTLRGLEVTLVEKSTVGSGTTTRCAGMLHSGARYVVKDTNVAKVCCQENEIIQSIAPFAVGSKKALFITVPWDDLSYHEQFEKSCSVIGIKIQRINKAQALEIEPLLNKQITGAYITPDVVINTFRLVEGLVYDIQQSGAQILENSFVDKVREVDDGWDIRIMTKQEKIKLHADYVVNATGDKLTDTAKLFNESIELHFIHGTIAILAGSIVKRIVSRCAPSTVGDVIVPLVNGILIGSTWHEIGSNKETVMSDADKEDLYKSSAIILQDGRQYQIISSFTGIRTHIKNDNQYGGNFSIKRDYAVLVHKNKNLISVLPGKLTTARFVAEKVGDEIASRLKIDKKSNSSRIVIKYPNNFKQPKIKFYVN